MAEKKKKWMKKDEVKEKPEEPIHEKKRPSNKDFRKKMYGDKE